MTDPNNAASPREVREWGNANGYTVAQRGRLSATLKEAFTEATGRPVWSPDDEPESKTESQPVTRWI